MATRPGRMTAFVEGDGDSSPRTVRPEFSNLGETGHYIFQIQTFQGDRIDAYLRTDYLLVLLLQSLVYAGRDTATVTSALREGSTCVGMEWT